MPHIYAAGDVIGFPVARLDLDGAGPPGELPHVRRRLREHAASLSPTASTRSPRSRWSGSTEQELTAAKIPYEVGQSHVRGARQGADARRRGRACSRSSSIPETLKLLGVHAIGEGATEIIHIGQAVLALGGTIEYFRDTVFNYPTLAEAYKVAGLDGLNRL